MIPQDLPALTLSCASSIYSRRAPNPRYALQTYGLMMMTGAHESDGWQARRQYSFAQQERETLDLNHRGAFGLHQLERGSVSDSLDRLHRNQPMLKRAIYWLQMQGFTAWAVLNLRDSAAQVLDLMRTADGDPLSVLFCRLHYMRVPAAIPDTPEEWARYAKAHYNTHLGAARPADYLRAWKALPTHVRI